MSMHSCRLRDTGARYSAHQTEIRLCDSDPMRRKRAVPDRRGRRHSDANRQYDLEAQRKPIFVISPRLMVRGTPQFPPRRLAQTAASGALPAASGGMGQRFVKDFTLESVDADGTVSESIPLDCPEVRLTRAFVNSDGASCPYAGGRDSHRLRRFRAANCAAVCGAADRPHRSRRGRSGVALHGHGGQSGAASRGK